MKKDIKINQSEPNQGRRKSLIGAGAVAGAAAVWHKPVMNNVVLPAHAQTTNQMQFSLTTTADQIGIQPFNIQQYFPQLSSAIQQQDKSFFTKVVDFVVPPAMAGSPSSSENFIAFYLAPDGENTYSLQLYAEGDASQDPDYGDLFDGPCIISLLFQADGMEIGVPKSSVGIDCFGEGGSGPDFTIDSIAEDGMSAVIDFSGITLELMADPAASPFSIVPCGCLNDVIESNTRPNVIISEVQTEIPR
jgi:hypothetical protein